MEEKKITPKARISSIDALRGFALFGILLVHCMEFFDLTFFPKLDSPFWQKVDTVVYDTIFLLFAGKSYAIFSLLFGLSFFMQMDSQAEKGIDFRWRFLWRLTLLLVIGYINGLIYMGEFFLVYAILGVFLVPLFKVPTKWLILIAVILFLQIPDIYAFTSALYGGEMSKPSSLQIYMGGLYRECAKIFINGSLSEVLQYNLWKGQFAKLLWVFNATRYPQLIGLFVLGLIIGRYGIHKSEEKIVKYSKKVLPYSIAFFVLCYAIINILPHIGLERLALRAGRTLFKNYANLGMMLMYISGFMLLYYKTKAVKVMDYLAPVGRMSVTSYMTQSLIGVSLFYGFGLSLATQLSFLQSVFVGLAIYALQLLFSNFWIKRYYYGPLEWLWRSATWFRKFPMKRT